MVIGDIKTTQINIRSCNFLLSIVITALVHGEINNRDGCHVLILFMEKSIIEIGVYPCHVHREINNRDGCQIPILFIEKLITEIRVTHIPILFIEKLITEMGVIYQSCSERN